MRASILALVFAVAFATTPAVASDSADAVATAHQFIDGVNKNDIKTAFAACASPASVIDEFPPHFWSGANACADWANDFDADAKKNGITDTVVTLGKPWRADVSGDRAYLVFPGQYAYKQHGKKMLERHSVWTVALKKRADGWRIVSWTWSRHD
jgi:ketosteroid isomerase-like protein